EKKNNFISFTSGYDWICVFVQEEHVETQYGTVHCILTGTARENRPAILTFHDVGLNHKSCFETLFNHEDMQEIIRHLPVCHVEAPGQHEGAKTLPTESVHYPSPADGFLSEALPAVLKHFRLRSVIGLGVGAGAYILAKFAVSLYYHDNTGIVHLNWLNHYIILKNLERDEKYRISVFHIDFFQDEIQTNHDLIATYRHHITATMNQSNVSQFLHSYNHRSALEVERPVPGGNINVRTLKCSTLLLVGDSSPAVEAVVDCNSKLNPNKTTLLKMADCGGLPQVDQPAKVIEALKYFIQGMGYLSSASMTRLRSRTTSGSSISSFDGSRSRAHTNELQRGRAHSHTSEEKHGRLHTEVSMKNTSNSNADQSISKSTEVAC
uniref:Protein NDRG1-like n=1 Tax=Mastacembelus armatus TaxID=205130 RepID=A0A3Q3NGE6_9TELE